MSKTAPYRADPVVVFPLSRWCPPQETSQPHPPHQLDGVSGTNSAVKSSIFIIENAFQNVICKMSQTFLWNHQQRCWFLYVESCNFGETNPQYRAPEIACQPRHVLMPQAGFALVWREHKCMWPSKQKKCVPFKSSHYSFFLISLYVLFFP